MTIRQLTAGKFTLALDRPLIMGIVNITPDSFSDGGHYFSRDHAIAHATKLINDGADILDIGGESTRPGASPATLAEELDRVIPVIEAILHSYPDIPLSVDTQKVEVMREAIRVGVAMINDVNALRAPDAVAVCAASNVAVCLMHMQGEPRTMQAAPQYENVVVEVRDFLLSRAAACEVAGIAQARIVIDPGIGFGKTLDHNLALLSAVNQFAATGYATLIGISRKSLFKTLLNLEVDSRLTASVVAALDAASRGASILRVHDVRETCDALRLVAAINEGI